MSPKIESFATALRDLLRAARHYGGTPYPTEEDLGRLQSLHVAAQFAAHQAGITLPPFERKDWRLEEATYGPVSSDYGKTWQDCPHYHMLQGGNLERRTRWIRELETLAEGVRQRIEAEETIPAARPKKPRRARQLKIIQLTPKEIEAAQLVGEHKGNVTSAARARGISRQAMKKLYDNAMKKLSKTAFPKPKTQQFPRDRRGQENI